MSNEEKLSISLPISRYLHEYALGPLPNNAIPLEDAKVLKLLEPSLPSIHVQMEDLDTGKPLDRPILWWSKEWYQDLKRREIEKENSEIRRKAALKQSESITKVEKYLIQKHKLPSQLAHEAAMEMILDRKNIKSVVETLTLLGISIDDLSEKEESTLGTYTIL